MRRAPIFIVGLPRSGTTLLQGLLSSSPEAYSLPETHFFSVILPELAKRPDDLLAPSDVESLLDLVRRLMELELPHARLEAKAEAQELTGKDVFECILEHYRPPEGGAGLRVIEKTPGHVEYLDQIAEHYPAARFVHVVRDPRNAISSVLQAPFNATRWLTWHAIRWSMTLRLVEAFAAREGDKIASVRYEDLVTDTVGVLRRVCEFVGLVYDVRMLEGYADQIERNVLERELTWKEDAGGPIRYEPLAWKKRLTAGEAWLIEQYSRRGREKYGYAPAARPGVLGALGALWGDWRLLRRDREAQRNCMWLAMHSMALGDQAAARRLALFCVSVEPSKIRRRPVRRMILGA